MNTRRDNDGVDEAGGTLARYRTAAGMSQQALAVAVDVTVTMVSRWETGRNVPRKDHAVELDQLLGAGGEIVRAFGYVKPSGDVAELRERVQELASQVAGLLELTAAQGAAIERLERAVRQVAAGSR